MVFWCQQQIKLHLRDNQWLDMRHCTDLESHTCYDVEYLVFLLRARVLRLQETLRMAQAHSAKCKQALLYGIVQFICALMHAAEAFWTSYVFPSGPRRVVRVRTAHTCTDALLASSEWLYFQSWTSCSNAATSTRCTESPCMCMRDVRQSGTLSTATNQMQHAGYKSTFYLKAFLASQALGKVPHAVNVPALDEHLVIWPLVAGYSAGALLVG